MQAEKGARWRGLAYMVLGGSPEAVPVGVGDVQLEAEATAGMGSVWCVWGKMRDKGTSRVVALKRWGSRTGGRETDRWAGKLSVGGGPGSLGSPQALAQRPEEIRVVQGLLWGGGQGHGHSKGSLGKGVRKERRASWGHSLGATEDSREGPLCRAVLGTGLCRGGGSQSGREAAGGGGQEGPEPPRVERAQEGTCAVAGEGLPDLPLCWLCPGLALTENPLNGQRMQQIGTWAGQGWGGGGRGGSTRSQFAQVTVERWGGGTGGCTSSKGQTLYMSGAGKWPRRRSCP